MLENDSDESCHLAVPVASPQEPEEDDQDRTRIGKVSQKVLVPIPDQVDARANTDCVLEEDGDEPAPQPRSCVNRNRPKFEISAKEATESAQERHRDHRLFKFSNHCGPYRDLLIPRQQVTVGDENEAFSLAPGRSHPEAIRSNRSRVEQHSKLTFDNSSPGNSPERSCQSRRFQINLGQTKGLTALNRTHKSFQDMVRRKFVFKTFVENVSKRPAAPQPDKARRKPGFLSNRTLHSKPLTKGSPKPLKELRGLSNLVRSKSRSFNEPLQLSRGVNEYNFPEIGDSDSVETPDEGTLTEDAHSYSTRTLFY